MDEGLFGLYNWYEDKPNKRTKNKSYLPDNPRYVKKEFNYITELKNENIILGHLRSFTIDRKLYKNIKSFEFKEYRPINNPNNIEIDNDKIAVQEIINKTYFVDENIDENIDGTVNWLKLNILRRMKKRGYDEEVSRKYVDEYSKKSQEILDKINSIDETLLNEEQKKKLENRKKELTKQSQRKCDMFHNIQPYTNDDYPDNEINDHNKDILLEKILIPNGESQMILSSNKVTSNYELNPKTIVNPWVSRYNMGYISWNMIINKATISCLLNPEHESSKWLFPARIILEKNPNDLFFENCFKELNNEEKTKYLGFFLIRYNLPKDEKIPPNTNEECKHLYSFSGSKPHQSKEQYYVMFVFKKLQADYKPHEYFIVNFRCNKIPWGDTGELTKILSSEIRQINCMYVNDKVKLYLLVKKKTRAGDALASSSGLASSSAARMTNEEIKSINEICKSQYEEENNIQQTQDKKSYLDCNEAWLHKETFDLLINNNILPYTETDTTDEKSNIHVLCTNKTINELAYYHDLGEIKLFENTDGQNIDYIELNDKDDNNEKYILTECHFKWDNDDDNDTLESRKIYDNHMKSYDINSTSIQKLEFQYKADDLFAEYLYNQENNKRFLIKHGPLDLDIKKEYKTNFCIKSNCLNTLDTVRFNKLQTLYNVDNIDEREIYSPDFVLNTTFANIKQSFQTNAADAAEQTGGNDNLSKLKFNKYVKKYYELVDVYEKDYKNNKNNNLPFHNNKFTNLPFYNNLIDNNFNNSKLFYNKDNIIKNGENILQNTNFITTIGVGAMFYLGHIKLNNILIIAHNIVYADKILHVFKNIKITLLVINNYEIGSFLTLKEKYNFVDIYFLGYYFNCLEPIKEICKNNIYDTIIIDPGEYIISQIISIVLGILLCKDYLHKDGTFMQYCLLPDNINYPANYIYIHNLLYKCFNYHVNNDFNFYFIMKQKYPTLLVYNNFIYNINKEEEKILLDILYNNYTNDTNYDSTYIKNKLEISPEFDSFLSLKWKNILFRSKEYLKTIEKQNKAEDKNLKGGYHRIAIKQMKIKIPQTIDDLLNKSKFNGDVKDMAPSCHWGQKKLLLSEIQFLTNVCKKLNTKSLNDYAVVYVGAADGFHFPILYNLFPELIWILYDPGKFSKESYMHPQKQKVKIFNQFFTDETIKHAQQNAENRKILFISDIRVTPKDEQVYTDMINQARWGTSIGADFMLLKFRLPYNEPDTFKPINIVDLKLNKTIINNNDLIAKDTIYLKGDVFLQLYHPQYSTELRLFVEKKNNKYELDNYDYIEIENKIFNYNTEIRLIADIQGYEFLNLIPGYNDSLECIMEYEIIKNYYEYFHNIKDKNIIIQKLYDLNHFLEKLTHKLFITCNLNTIIKSLNNKHNIIKKDRLLKLNIWKQIIQLNISISAKYQKDYITKYGLEIIGEERLKKSLKFIEKFITKKTYYELII
jgi:hypothetical protein